MTPDATSRGCAHPECDRPVPTEPDGELGMAGGELCSIHDGATGDDADSSTAGLNLQAVDPETDVPEEPHVGLLDFDDVRGPETSDVAWERRSAVGAPPAEFRAVSLAAFHDGPPPE